MGYPIINSQVDAINSTLATIKTDLQALRPSIRAIRDAVAETYLTETIQNQAIASFSDGADDIPVRELEVAITPIQSLNGQANPYPAGGGKNKVSSSTFTHSNTITKSGEKFTFAPIQSGVQILIIPYAWSAADSPCAISFDYWSDSSGAKFSVDGQPDSLYVSGTSFSDRTFTASTTKQRGSVSGTILTNTTSFRIFRTSTSALATTANIYIENVQVEMANPATDYAPYSNICPITGWSAANVYRTGVNVWDEVWEVGGFNGDGSKNGDTARIRSKNYISVKPNTAYNIHGRLSVFTYDANKTNVGATGFIGDASGTPYTLTTDADTYYLMFMCNTAYGTTYNNDISINYPSTDTAYHAYNGTTATLTFGQTVYGGKVDAKRGKVTITHAEVDLGSLSWTYYTSGTYPFFYADTSNGKQFETTGLTVNAFCSSYPVMATSQAGGSFGADASARIAVNGRTGITGTRWLVRDGNYTDAPTFTTAVTGQKLVYELATPVEVDITAAEIMTLFGQNNVWADTGNVVKLTYRKAWEIALAEE